MRADASWRGQRACAEAVEPGSTRAVPERADCSCAGPDSSALVRLLDDRHQRLFRLARRLSSNHEEARDLLQETLVRVLRSRTAMPADVAGLEPWAITVMVNTARDRQRRRAVRSRVAAREAHEPSAGGSPEPAYVARITVQGALARLDARRRAVIVLHYLEEEPVSRVAEFLRISPVTVRWHLARARRQLAALLTET
jgi:RNA polymerase sigma factor (sigma-70 family)